MSSPSLSFSDFSFHHIKKFCLPLLSNSNYVGIMTSFSRQHHLKQHKALKVFQNRGNSICRIVYQSIGYAGEVCGRHHDAPLRTPLKEGLVVPAAGNIEDAGGKETPVVFRVGLRYREHLPKAIPFLGTILAHCQITLMGPTYSISPYEVGQGLVRPTSQFDFSLYNPADSCSLPQTLILNKHPTCQTPCQCQLPDNPTCDMRLP